MIIETNREKIARLRREAEHLDNEAIRLTGTTWLGDEPPSVSRRREAAEKRELARLLETLEADQ